MHSAAYLLATFTLLSAILAFLRDRLLAHTFGAGLSLDIYYAAFRVPDLVFVTIASLVSAYVLIPELSRRSKDAQIGYIETVFAYFFVGIVIVSSMLFVLAPHILAVLFPALVTHGELVVMTRIMLLQPILLGCSNILAAVVQARGRYVIYALSPLVYNLGIIVGVVFLYPILGMYGLAWGVVLGAVMHLSMAVPSVFSDGYLRVWPRFRDFAAFVRTMRTSLPRTLALSASHVTFFVLIALASTLSVGSITVFTFAFNLQSVPIAIIGVSYSVAAFPLLAAAYVAGKREEFVGLIAQALRHIIFWLVPLSILLIVTRAQVVRVILGSGEFDWADTRLTAAVFALFMVALLAQAAMPLLARAYYAAGESWAPFFVNVLGAVCAIALAYWLSTVFLYESTIRSLVESLLRVSDVPGTEVLALPFAYASAAMLAIVLLAIHFEWRFGGLFGQIRRVLIEALVAGLVGGAAAYGTLVVIGGLAEPRTFLVVFADGAAAGLAGYVAVAVVYILFGSVELKETYRALVRRVRPQKASVIVSAEDELS